MSDLIKSLDNVVDHINHENYNDALSSIHEAKESAEKAIKILTFIKNEMPKAMGEPNFQLLYDDIVEAHNALTPK